MPRADREQQLLAVAEGVFAQHGLAISMDELARRAGISKPVLYDHFGSKDGLIVACFARARAQLLAETVAAVATATSTRERLELGLRAFFTFIDAHGDAFGVLLTDAALSSHPPAQEMERIRAQQAEVITRLLAGDLPGTAADELMPLAEAVIGATERLAVWRRGRPDVTPARAAVLLMGLLWDGLSAQVGGAPR